MTTLSQELPKDYPGSVKISVGGFHAALVAIGREMHEETQAGHQSLGAWWQWLDDEGYERQAFAEVLCQIGRTTIGDEAFAELTAYSKSIENDPDGISTLIEYTNKHYPDLTEEIAKIEKLAEEEDIKIQNMAGGVSKVGKDVLIGVGTTAGVGLVVLGGKGIHSYWKRNKAKPESRIVEKVEIKGTNDVQQETGKLENFAIENGRAREVAPQAATKVEKNLVSGRGLSEQEQARLDEAVEKEMATHKSELQYKLLMQLEDDFPAVAEGERAGVIERITAKFMPNKIMVENDTYHKAANYIKDINTPGRDVFPHEAAEGIEDKYLKLATRAELRKDRKALGQIVDAELKPELETVFSDSEIDSLFDFDKRVIDELTFLNGRPEEYLAFWGKESALAKGVVLRHPCVKLGLREDIRDVAMKNMTTFNREQALKNLKKHNRYGRYLKTDVYKKMAEEAKKQAIKEERLIKEKTDFKQELKEYLNKDKTNIEKETTEVLDSEAQVIKEKEAEEAKGTLDAIEKSEKESISVEITSEVDDVIIETKQATRAAEKKAGNSLDDI